MLPSPSLTASCGALKSSSISSVLPLLRSISCTVPVNQLDSSTSSPAGRGAQRIFQHHAVGVHAGQFGNLPRRAVHCAVGEYAATRPSLLRDKHDVVTSRNSPASGFPLNGRGMGPGGGANSSKSANR